MNSSIRFKGTGGAFSPARLAQMRQVMAGHADSGALPGVVTLISRRGETHAEAYGKLAFDGDAPMQRDTIFRIASVSKPITSVAAMILVEECKVRLMESVENWLPELANRQVLKRIDGPVDDTVPANRAITLHDLLTFRFGFGFSTEMFAPGVPIVGRMAELGMAPGPWLPEMSPDEYMKRIGSMPLMFQPGERWLYNNGSDILGVLISRVSGMPFGEFLRERIFEPLGMKDSGFYVPAEKAHRLPPAYMNNPQTGKIEFFDDTENSRFAQPPAFESGAGGMVSTADDLHAFGQMMLNQGKLGDVRILARPTIQLMTTDQLTPSQRVGAIMPESGGWGLGTGVIIKRHDIQAVPGQFGWDGGYGTSFFVDPENELIGVLLTQKLWDAPIPPPVCADFWTCTYAALED